MLRFKEWLGHQLFWLGLLGGVSTHYESGKIRRVYWVPRWHPIWRVRVVISGLVVKILSGIG